MKIDLERGVKAKYRICPDFIHNISKLLFIKVVEIEAPSVSKNSQKRAIEKAD